MALARLIACPFRSSVDIQLLHAGGGQPAGHNGHEPLHQLVAELMVLVALLAQPGTVEGQPMYRIGRPGVERPAIWWQQPGPADDTAGAERLDGYCPAVAEMHADGDLPRLDQVEGDRRLSLPGQELAGCCSELPGAAGETNAKRLAQVVQERMLAECLERGRF